MKKMISTVFGLSLVLFAAGCGTRSMVVLIPAPDGSVGKLVVANEGGQQILDKANQSVRVSGRKTPPGEATVLSADEIRAAFSDALDAQPPPPARFILYFLRDSNELTGESKAVLPEIVQTIREMDSTDIVISGHTDTVGSKEYNFNLSLDRAKTLSDILVANGAAPANITVTSHGEGNPLVKTPDDVAEPRNRRVEVVIK